MDFLRSFFLWIFWILPPFTFAEIPAILSPKNGSTIAPNAHFDFNYQSVADYGISSYNYTVWLFTKRPSYFEASERFAEGYYFGRFAQPNNPGNPYPPNQPPSQLTMPDCSKLGGGFGVGAHANHTKVYIAVIEEYETGDPSLGYRMSLTMNEVIYNGTSRH